MKYPAMAVIGCYEAVLHFAKNIFFSEAAPPPALCLVEIKEGKSMKCLPAGFCSGCTSYVFKHKFQFSQAEFGLQKLAVDFKAAALFHFNFKHTTSI